MRNSNSCVLINQIKTGNGTTVVEYRCLNNIGIDQKNITLTEREKQLKEKIHIMNEVLGNEKLSMFVKCEIDYIGLPYPDKKCEVFYALKRIHNSLHAAKQKKNQ